MSRTWVFIAAVNGLISVAAGAFGAHGLKNRLAADVLSTFETAARYQMYHALALLAVAWLVRTAPSSFATAAGWLFTIGIVIFSGSLYALCLTGQRWLGAVTPIGGLAMLAVWACLAAAGLRLPRP